MDFQGVLLVPQALFQVGGVGPVLLQEGGPFSLFEKGEVGVLGNLAQPHLQPALPVEGVDGLQRLEKGLLGHLFRHVGGVGQL